MTDSIIVPCVQCATLNRIPQAKRHAQAQCGVCKQPVLSAQPFDLTPETFSQQSKGDIPLLVDVWASWCGPCRQFAPTFSAAASQLMGQCRFAKLDSEAHPALSGQLAVRSIPSLILFRNGKEIARQSGALPLSQLLAWLQQYAVHN